MNEPTFRTDLRRFARQHKRLTAKIGELREWIVETGEPEVSEFDELCVRLQSLYAERPNRPR